MMDRVTVAPGVTLDVATAGDPSRPAMLFLHGFPESHRTWRHQIAALSEDWFCIAPDQRGFARSSKPSDVADYRIDRLVADVIALVDHYGAAQCVLVAHDWGGAVGWATALRHPDRISRLVIANAPHPLIFQRSLIDDPAQRAASQYIHAFRSAGFDAHVDAIGLDAFFDRSFAPHVDPSRLTAQDRADYLAEWAEPGALTAMLNWYRASAIFVPAIDAPADLPDWTTAPFPVLTMPVFVVWGSPVGTEVAYRFPDASIIRRDGAPRPFLDARTDARRRLEEAERLARSKKR